MKKLLLFITIFLRLAPPASTYYVNKSGNDANSCATAKSSTPANGKLTVAAGLACLASADTLIIGTGTYTEGIVYNSIPDGIDDSNHTIVRADTGATVVINGVESNGFTAAISGAYKSLLGPGLTINAVNATNGVGIYLWGTDPVKANHILIQDVEVKNVTGGTSACITAGGDGTDVHHITMNRLNVHDCVGGTPTTHGIYLHMNDSIVEDSTIHATAGYGIQQYSGVAVALSNNTIQRNTIYDVAQDGTSYGALYLGQTNSDNTLVFNNVMYNSGGPGSCIQENGTLNTLIYNNVCDGFAAAGGVSGFIREGTSGVDLGSIAKNNIGWSNTPLNTIFGSAWTQSNNICGSGCASSSDPLFVSVGSGNFNLLVGSPAIGAGVNLCSAFCTDRNGAARPAMGAWDLGAYVYATVTHSLTTLGAGSN